MLRPPGVLALPPSLAWQKSKSPLTQQPRSAPRTVPPCRGPTECYHTISLRVPCADLDSTMPGYLGLTAFATLLGGVSALVPSSPGAAHWPRCASRVATPIVARFDCVEPAAKPSFMLHSRVAEPTDVASVPAAAGPLSLSPFGLLSLTLSLTLT